MRSDQIEGHTAFGQPWYYVIELGPGLFTPGKERPNVALTRRLLRNIEVGPHVRCLDIGVQEGLVSILLERRGAEVVAYDRVYSEERLRLVRDALDAEFELIGQPVARHTDPLWLGRGGPSPGSGMPLTELPSALRDRRHPPFDVVVFSGVLYHVYDPLASLAIVRGLVRTGGIVIVETAATFDGELTLQLNGASRFNPLSIWLPTVACLDYLLRLVRLEPLDAVHYGRHRGRIAVACRAVPRPPADPGDTWIGSPLHDYELAEYLDWSEVSSSAPPVGYSNGGSGRIDILDAVRTQRPYRPRPAESRLDLTATL